MLCCVLDIWVALPVEDHSPGTGDDHGLNMLPSFPQRARAPDNDVWCYWMGTRQAMKVGNVMDRARVYLLSIGMSNRVARSSSPF